MYANQRECEKAGLDIKKVESIARRLSKAAKEASDIGVHIFGGSGSGSLRFDDRNDNGRNLIIADCLLGMFDGGDGAAMEDDEGFLRGE